MKCFASVLRTKPFAAFFVCAALVACGGGGSTSSTSGFVPTSAPSATPSPMPSATVAPSISRFIGYWESWDDTNTSDPYAALSALPAGVSIVDIAFFSVNGNTCLPPQNTNPLASGAAALHARGTKIYLSIGGGDATFGVTNLSGCIGAISAYLAANPGVYDGFDIDDENIWSTGEQDAIAFVTALHAQFPSMPISWTSYYSAADAPAIPGDPQGEDIALMQAIGPLIAFVNVMEYGAQTWIPPEHPNCAWGPNVSDDCYTDILGDFAALDAGGVPLGRGRVVMGLMISPTPVPPGPLQPSQMGEYAAWIKSQGYGGMMIWDVNRDRLSVSGQPTGSFMQAIASGL